MKIVEKNLKQCYVKVIPSSQDDLWHLFNTIFKGDEVYAFSSRTIKSDEEYSRPKSGERISAFIGVKVESVSWDRFLGKLRIHGFICQAPEVVPQGAHHTLSIAVRQPVTIVKQEWPRHLLDRLTLASRSEKPMLILAIDDESYAVAETKQYGVDIKVEERFRLPGKREAEKREAATKQYFSRILRSLNETWASRHDPVVILGVGSLKNDFARFLVEEAAEISKSVVDVKSVNNGGTAGIYEALRSGILSKAASKLRIVEETEAVEEVMLRLGKNEGRVTYGMGEVENAVGYGAVGKLIVADSLLRESEDRQRLLLENLMNEVERRKGSVTVVSTEHEAGAKLVALGGIAALLRFSIR